MVLRAFFATLTAAGVFLCAPFSALTQSQADLPLRVTEFSLTEAPDDHVVGSDDAAITLIVWASVTCPHCGDWFTNEWPILKSELVDTGKLRFVFRQFPTAPGELSMTGFRLAECAPREDYMSVIEYQMENQDAIFKAAQEGRAPQVYGEIAKLAGMETDDAISSCLRNPDITAHIIDNANRAALAKIKGVPAFLINGQSYDGAQDAKSLVTLINEMEDKGMSALPNVLEPVNPQSRHNHD